MSKKTLLAIIVIDIIILVSGLIYILGLSPVDRLSTGTGQINADSNPPVTNQTNAIIYSGSGFSPQIITVKAGDTVIYKNQSSREFWPASDAHPTHTLYPTTGGCVGSTFDACHGLKPGEIWLFKFNIEGNWGYHNHLNPAQTGRVMVKP